MQSFSKIEQDGWRNYRHPDIATGMMTFTQRGERDPDLLCERPLPHMGSAWIAQAKERIKGRLGWRRRCFAAADMP